MTEYSMAPPSHADIARKEEYFEILDETIRTNPYRKAATAMASVINKHGITSDASNVLGKPSAGLPEKKCALTRALRLAQNCNQKLNITKDELQSLCCDLGSVKCEKLKDNENPKIPTVESPSDRAVMTGHLLTLIGEAQTIAKRIYETAVGLHVAEDYLRQPDDLKLLDFSARGRIQIPNYNFNHASQLCLEWLHSTAIKWLRGFKEDGGDENIQFIKVFENFTKAVRDYTEAVCLANQVFRVFLYPNTYGKETLREYVLSLGHVLKNDIMMEVQSLRRAFDSIQYSFERLGWAASIAWMKYSGQNITVETLNENGIQVDHSVFQHKFFEGPSKSKKSTDRNTTASSSTTSVKQDLQNLTVKPETIVEKPLTAQSKKRLSVDDRRERTAKKDESAKSMLHRENSGESRPISRTSQSTPEVSKSKKPLKKKEKQQQINQIFMRTTTADNQSEAVLSGDESNTRLALLKLLKNDKAYQVSGLQSSNNSINSMKGKPTPLTPAPKIPAAWRKQFGAVFGMHLVPPKVKVARKTKKKAGGVSGANQKQTKNKG